MLLTYCLVQQHQSSGVHLFGVGVETSKELKLTLRIFKNYIVTTRKYAKERKYL
jgi:hypothetical protein